MTVNKKIHLVTSGAMAFMMKKKKYKFQVEMSLDELIEVPFVSAVLFAKVRLLDGGNFQDYSTREEVKDHKVKWGAHFEFPCKMTANASTGVLEPCVLRVSVRKEIKGGRSFLKHGFCDINLAELAGSGQVSRRYLLEGYDSRHRSDNSMLKVTLSMNMLSGDILFKVPSPTTKIPTSVGTTEEVESVVVPDSRTPDDFSGGSLAGSVASGSSGFGSLPKKRPALFNSELLNNTNSGSNDVLEVPNSVPELNETVQSVTNLINASNNSGPVSNPVATCATPDMLGHSRNSSTTSQMSRASGYSTQHSRQSSSGDSTGHIRSPSWPVWAPNSLTPPFSPPSPSMTLMDPKRNQFWALEYTKIKSLRINVHSLDDNDLFSLSSNNTPLKYHLINSKPTFNVNNSLNTTPEDEVDNTEVFITPNGNINRDHSNLNLTNSSEDEVDSNVTLRVPKNNVVILDNTDNLSLYINRQFSNLSSSSNEVFATPDSTLRTDVNEQINLCNPSNYFDLRKSQSCSFVENQIDGVIVRQLKEHTKPKCISPPTITRSFSSDNSKTIVSKFEIPKINYQKPLIKNEGILHNIAVKRDNLIQNILTPLTRRRAFSARQENKNAKNNCNSSLDNDVFKVPVSSTPINSKINPVTIPKSPLPAHRAISLGSLRSSSPIAVTKRAAFAQKNDRNSSAGSLALSETGSLDRAKSALERRKRTQEIIDLGSLTSGGSKVSGHVEVTRVNPENLIAEIISSTNLEQEDETAETSGLQLFIAQDGTAALGNHEVKSQISSGVQVFKQVVIEEKR